MKGCSWTTLSCTEKGTTSVPTRNQADFIQLIGEMPMCPIVSDSRGTRSMKAWKINHGLVSAGTLRVMLMRVMLTATW